jgi:hypothetical protein
MIKILFRTSFLIFLNYIVILQSKNIDAQQIVTDINRFIIFQDLNERIVYFIIGITIAMVTLWFLFIFKPFIEVYLLYYFKYGFYFLINFISISSVYITFRIYGYSRLYLLLYLLTSSFLMLLSDKIK